MKLSNFIDFFRWAPSKQKSSNKDYAAIFILTALVTVFVLPYLWDIKKVLIEESILQHYSYVEFNRQSILIFKKIPFWSPYFGGGYPFYRHPSNMIFSPLFYLFILPFGSVCGSKLAVLFSYYIGVIGMYFLTRHYFKFNILGSFFSSGVFILNSYLPYQLSTGGYPFVNLLYVPFIFYCFLRAKKNNKYLFCCAFLLVLIFLNGINLKIAPIFLFLCFFSLLRLLISKETVCLKKLTIIVTFFMLLGAVKLIPLVNLLSSDSVGKSLPRNITALRAYEAAESRTFDWNTLRRAILHPGPYLSDERELPGLPDGLNVGSVMYFGIIPVVFFLAGSILYFRELKTYLILLFFFVALIMGSHFIINILNYLNYIPVFNSIYSPAKYYTFYIVLLISLVSGKIFSAPYKFKCSKSLVTVLTFLGLFGMADMFLNNILYFTTLSSIKKNVTLARRQDDFFQISFLDKDKDRTSFKRYRPDLDIPSANSTRVEDIGGGMQYFLLKQNIGKIDWFGDLELDESAVPRYYGSAFYGNYWYDADDIRPENGIFINPGYKGEAHLQGSDIRVKFKLINPDTFELTGNLKPSDTVIINQNYDRFWRTTIGSVDNFNGLISIKPDLPASSSGRLPSYTESHGFQSMDESVVGSASEGFARQSNEEEPRTFVRGAPPKIKVYYQPRDLIYGGIVSLTSLIVIFSFFIRKRLCPVPHAGIIKD